MSETPVERPARPRQDPGAADIDTQIDMGWAEPQPEPTPPEPAPSPDPEPGGQ